MIVAAPSGSGLRTIVQSRLTVLRFFARACERSPSRTRHPLAGWLCWTLWLAITLQSGPGWGACEGFDGLSAFQNRVKNAKLTAYYYLQPERAYLEMQAAEALLNCLSEPVSPSELISFYLWQASIALDLNQSNEVLRSARRAALLTGPEEVSEPELNRTVRLLYQKALDTLHSLPSHPLRLAEGVEVQAIRVDGHSFAPSERQLTLFPGEHFVQLLLAPPALIANAPSESTPRSQKATGEAAPRWPGFWLELPAQGLWRLGVEQNRPRLLQDSDPVGSTDLASALLAAAASGPSGDSPGGIEPSTKGTDAATPSLQSDAPGDRRGTPSPLHLRRLALGLGAATLLSGALFSYEEYLYRSGQLIDEQNTPVPDYRFHYNVHWVSGVAGLVLLTGTGVVGVMSLRKEPPPDAHSSHKVLTPVMPEVRASASPGHARKVILEPRLVWIPGWIMGGLTLHY